MDGKTILPRSEVPEEFTWDLSHVFASDDKWNEELEALKAYPERMAAYAGKLGGQFLLSGHAQQGVFHGGRAEQRGLF